MLRSPTILLRFLLLALAPSAVIGEPILSSWYTEQSSRYARVYETWAEETAQNAVTTWVHPNGGNSQALPVYAGIHELSHSSDWVYLRTSGLGSHVMGPWYQDSGNPTSGIFVNWPGNTAALFRIPRIDTANPPLLATPTQTGGGPIGYFVDGVAQFDSRDAFSYSNGNVADAEPGTAFAGDGVWNRDAYVNEGATFDRANAHQAGATYHYHANPPALRHLLGDSVAHDPATNLYTEAFNGQHSPILGWVRDGLPIYGPYGYGDPANPASAVRRMISGYQMRDGTNGSVDLTNPANGRTTHPAWADRVYNGTSATTATALSPSVYGPDVSAQYPLGHYLEDYAYRGDLGQTLGVDFDLDENNCRFCVTPEFPGGTWAYFVAIEADGTPRFPYNIGRTFKAEPSGGALGEISEPTTLVHQGGPGEDRNPEPSDPLVDPSSGDVSIVWRSVEGGGYVVETDEDLVGTWTSAATLVSAGPEPFEEVIDPGAAAGLDRRFYRIGRTGLADFDTAGFEVAAPSRIEFTVPDAPGNLTRIPTVTMNGSAVTAAVSRPSRYVVAVDIDPATLAPGIYDMVATFPGPLGSQAGIYAVADNTKKDNVLLVIIDDWGVESSDLYNANPAATPPPMPTLQSLASSGVLFANAYTQPLCSPTRSSIMSGRYAFRTGVGHPNTAMPESELTLPEAFGSTNSHYQLASFGKWHLSGAGGVNNNTVDNPRIVGGWPYFEGIYGGAVPDYFNWQKIENGSTYEGITDYPTTVIVDDTIGWITRQTDPERPWFAWVAFNAAHTPFHAPPSELHSYGTLPAVPVGAQRRTAFEATLESIDTELARLLASVDLATTNVIVLGDNGSPAAVVQSPFLAVGGRNHAKGSLYDGGSHVPFVISGPAAVGGGRTSDALVHCVDLFRTVLDLCGIPQGITGATEIDSVSLVDVLANTSSVAHGDILVETFGGATTEANVGRAIYDGTYRLIEYANGGGTGIPTYELYHLPSDENEETDLNDGSMTGAETAAFNALQSALAGY